MAQQPEQPSRSDRKMEEIASVIKLTPKQNSTISEAWGKRNLAIDSLLLVSDSKERAYKKYSIEKQFHEVLIGCLTDKQISNYVNIVFAPEVDAKTEYRLSLLLEQENLYSETEITKMKAEIYNYLMLEKIVYFKDKYDFAKQKNNISRLKALQPTSLKSSNNLEKQKGYGKFMNGKINW